MRCLLLLFLALLCVVAFVFIKRKSLRTAEGDRKGSHQNSWKEEQVNPSKREQKMEPWKKVAERAKKVRELCKEWGSKRSFPLKQVTLIILFVWFLSLISNELRQLYLAWKNKNVRQTYLTTSISGNIVDILSYLFFLIAFILHFASYSVHATDYPQGPLVIHPQLNEDDFSLYCPFILPNFLVIAQACFHNLNILCYCS